MALFWIVGIGINLLAFGALVWWAVRSWRRSAPPTGDEVSGGDGEQAGAEPVDPSRARRD